MYVWSFFSKSVSGSPVKSMAGYDHYEEIVSSPCSPLSCHCRTNMVEILFRPHMTYRHTKVHLLHSYMLWLVFNRGKNNYWVHTYIYIHTYITCSPGTVMTVDLLLNPRQRDEGRGWIRSQWIDYILPSPSNHCHVLAKTHYMLMRPHIHTQWDSMPELSFSMAA